QVPGQGLERDQRQCEEIGAPIQSPRADHLLRGTVRGSPYISADTGKGAGPRAREGYAKIRQHRAIGLVLDQDVGRFDVAMDHATWMNEIECGSDILQDSQQVRQRE